jgi:hypothetical protein
MTGCRPTGHLSMQGLFLGLLLAGPSITLADGRLAGTGGVSSINGTGGGGLTGWATLASYADRGQIGGTFYASRADVDDFHLDVLGASATFTDRLEVGVARQRFTIKAANSRIEQDRFAAKLRVAGDLLYGDLPQISMSAEHGRLRDTGTALAVGAADTEDTDYVISAARAWIDGVLHRTTLLNINLRRSRANQYGILGFGGDDPDREWQAEAALAWFPTHDIAIGAEYRQKPDNLSALHEQSARDLFVAWFPNKHMSVTGAWLDLGSIAGQPDQTGFYLSLQAAF